MIKGKGNRAMRVEYEFNGKPVPKEQGKALALRAGLSMVERHTQSRMDRRVARLPDAPERRSVAHAMLMVEIRLVKAFWTIARLPLGSVAPLGARKNGVEYFHDRDDTHARYVDAASGKWETPPPRPSLPSSKEIDQANEALDWLLLINDEMLRKILVVGATAKRGDAGCNISWPRVRASMKEIPPTFTSRMLRVRYREALRMIVTEMTLARLAA